MTFDIDRLIVRLGRREQLYTALKMPSMAHRCFVMRQALERMP